MSETLELISFKNVNLGDPFFSTLKEDYKKFPLWFAGKANEEAYIFRKDDELLGFMYPKLEEGEVTDVIPPLPAKRRIKIGTFKVLPHGTKLGQRLLKKAFDHAIFQDAEELYVTVLPKHQTLIQLLTEFGFEDHGLKETEDGTEKVFIKTLTKIKGEIRKDYPLIRLVGNRKFLLSIYPKWHTKLFPDSILNSETYDILNDMSHTNSIEKTYVCFMDLSPLSSGDLVIIYRTSDKKAPAYYRSVVTSICTVEELKARDSFLNTNEYVEYTEPYSVFNRPELLRLWSRTGNIFVVKMLYNAAFSRRVIRKQLINEVGLFSDEYWGFMEITDEQFRKVIKLGGLHERLVVDKTRVRTTYI